MVRDKNTPSPAIEPRCLTLQQASRERRAQQYIGAIMTQFMAWTGLVPSDAIPTAEGKTFVIVGTCARPVPPEGACPLYRCLSSPRYEIEVDLLAIQKLPSGHLIESLQLEWRFFRLHSSWPLNFTHIITQQT